MAEKRLPYIYLKDIHWDYFRTFIFKINQLINALVMYTSTGRKLVERLLVEQRY